MLASAACSEASPNWFVGNVKFAAEGKKSFRRSCAPSHGATGERSQGQLEKMRPVDLTRGVFKAGRWDEDMLRIVLDCLRFDRLVEYVAAVYS